MRRLSVAVLAAAVVSVLAVAASPSVAHAAEPCWQRVLDDWTKDGKLDGQYSPRCLRQAIKHTPEDLRDYSSIDDDIQAALLGHFGASSGPNSGGSGTGSGSGSGSGGTGQKQLAPAEAQRRAEQAVPHAGTEQSIPDASRPLPIPLLILASVALAAILAAASPPLIHRLRTRFPRTRAAPQPDR
ncbi:MAG TPA: hypothetical protein VE757_03500 [Gaiellaceae bacterium]|nr:hypothetical protein [Gaiellaceae bacterium]